MRFSRSHLHDKTRYEVSWKNEYGQRYTFRGLTYSDLKQFFRWIQNQKGYTLLESERIA